MKIVVTGATGFFGPAIVRRLQAAGHDVVGASRRMAGDARLDVTDPRSCEALFRAHPGVQAVVHAAALAHVPAAAAAAWCQAVNVDGTANLLRAAVGAGVTRWVYISSVTAYGEYGLPVPVTEDTMPGVLSVYGAAKRQAEALIDAQAPQLERWSLRMATMYSPEWLFNVRKRVSLPLVGGAIRFTLDPDTPRYTLCSQRNGAEAVAWAVEHRVPPGVYNVADAHTYSQREILSAVEAVEGRGLRLAVPKVLVRGGLALMGALSGPRIRRNARSRYWKFCEHNVYSAAKLASFGLTLPPDLLTMTGAHA